MLAAGVVGAAMGIKLSAVPKGEELENLKEPFSLSFLSLLNVMMLAWRRVFLPHLSAMMVLLFLAGIGFYQLFEGVNGGLTPLGWICLALFLFIYGSFCFGYAVVLSFVFSIKEVAVCVEDFLYALFSYIKANVLAKINNMEEGIPKQQAKIILNNSIKEVFLPLRSLHLNSILDTAAALLLLLFTFVSRCVFLARLARFSTKTVQFSKLFASRATLVGALFLNLRWLSILLLGILYVVVFIILIINIWWVC